MKYFFFWLISAFPAILSIVLQEAEHFLLAIVSLSICSISEQLPKLAEKRMGGRIYFIFIYFVASITCLVSTFMILK